VVVLTIGGRRYRAACPSLADLAAAWKGEHPSWVAATFGEAHTGPVPADLVELCCARAGRVLSGERTLDDYGGDERVGMLVRAMEACLLVLGHSLRAGDPDLTEGEVLEAIRCAAFDERGEDVIGLLVGELDRGIEETLDRIPGCEEIGRELEAWERFAQVWGILIDWKRRAA
jgi:hypothetical protein